MSTTPLRRHLQPQADESLLLSMIALDVPYRLEEFAEASGLPDERIYSSPLLSIPLPLYLDDTDDDQRHWSSVKPSIMWHPLMWLPPRVADRYTVPTDKDPNALEDDDMWAVRVALEMTASGLYDQAEGGWVDILHLVGVDITSETGLAQVQRWLNGSPDPILDEIDLDAYLTADDDPDWAIRSVIDLMPHVRGASAACIADSLRGLTLNSHNTAAERATIGRLARSLLPEGAGPLPEPEDSLEEAVAKLTSITQRFEADFVYLVTLEEPDDQNDSRPEESTEPTDVTAAVETGARFIDVPEEAPSAYRQPVRVARW